MGVGGGGNGTISNCNIQNRQKPPHLTKHAKKQIHALSIMNVYSNVLFITLFTLHFQIYKSHVCVCVSLVIPSPSHVSMTNLFV
mmetsp:Transcript_6571/g.9626  ORF Transcript_6571/g.9626 Transcript_6571/m.9626 type:complete len:84 (+) Transcript_6571:2-253(+)